VRAMINSKSVSICNLSHARLVDNSRNRTFSRGYPNSMTQLSIWGQNRIQTRHLNSNISTIFCESACLMFGATGEF